MSKPTPKLLEAAERVLAYLIRNKHIGLRYHASERPLFGMTDSDWAVSVTPHQGGSSCYPAAAISWGSKRQVSVALSSCKAEIMATSEASKEAVYLKKFAEELELFPGGALELYEDNRGARDLAYNPQNIMLDRNTLIVATSTCASSWKQIRVSGALRGLAQMIISPISLRNL